MSRRERCRWRSPNCCAAPVRSECTSPRRRTTDARGASMQIHNGTRLFSATDLVGFLECEHLTTLALEDLVERLPRAVDDESAMLVQQKGIEHEANYLATLNGSPLRVAEIGKDGGTPAELMRETIA